MAIGITLTVIGTTITWLFSALGIIIFVVTLVMSIRDTRRDISELPEDHSTPTDRAGRLVVARRDHFVTRSQPVVAHVTIRPLGGQKLERASGDAARVTF